MLHDLVIVMGINTDVIYLLFTKGQCFSQYAFALSVSGNPVYGAVRGIVLPCAVFDEPIGRFYSGKKSKDTTDTVLFNDYIGGGRKKFNVNFIVKTGVFLYN
jgi:hypothetical protein